MAGGGQGGRLPVQVPHLGVGAPDQLPAARGTPRVHGRVVAGQRHGPRGNCGAGRAAARHFQLLVLPDHVPEAGGEAGEGHGPDLPGVGGDHAVGSQAGEPSDFGEVLAVVHGVDDHQLTVALDGCGEVELHQAGGDAPGRGRGLGLDQDGLGRGQDVLLARQRFLEEQCLQGEHVLGAGELSEDRARPHGPHGADLVNCGFACCGGLYLQGFPCCLNHELPQSLCR